MGALGGLLGLARHLALRAGDVKGLVHRLVPRLLLGGDVHRRLVGLAVVAGIAVLGLEAVVSLLDGEAAQASASGGRVKPASWMST